MSLLVNLLVLCVIIAVLYWIAKLVSPSLPPPLQAVPLVIVAIIGLVLLLNMLGAVGEPMWRVRL